MPDVPETEETEAAEWGRGDAVKDVLRLHRPDEAWRVDLDDLRSMLEFDERS